MNEFKAVELLKNTQKFILAIEGILIDVISMITPYLTPLLPSFLTWKHLTEILKFPNWVGLASAAVVELLGLSAVHTSLTFWQYNQKNKKQRAPLTIAAMIAGFYMLVILVVNVALDNSPAIHRLTKGLLSTLSLAGALVIALRAGHSRRLEQETLERNERKKERQERKERTKYGKIAERKEQNGQSKMTKDWRTLPQTIKKEIGEMSKIDIIQKFNTSERTARNWIRLAKQNNKN